MTIYLVRWWDMDGTSEVVGAFSTREKADSAASKASHCHVEEYILDEIDEWFLETLVEH